MTMTTIAHVGKLLEGGVGVGTLLTAELGGVGTLLAALVALVAAELAAVLALLAALETVDVAV